MEAIKKHAGTNDETGARAEPPSGRQGPNAAGLRPALNHAYFEAVYRHGSIRKAATALHIASSALNRRILDLEEEVGTPLFERLPRGVHLTAAGELFLAYVQRASKELQLLQTQIGHLQEQVRGNVRIAVAESVTASLLPSAIAQYRAAHPGVGFHVTVDGPGPLGEALLQDSVDLILTHELVDQPGISVLATASHPLCALVALEHPLAKHDEVSLSECAKYPWALPDRTLAVRSILDAALERSSVRPASALESNSIETLKTYARKGEAVCFSFHLGNAEEATGLVPLKLKDRHCAQARIFLAARRGRVLPVAAASFAEQLKEELQQGLTLRLMSSQ